MLIKLIKDVGTYTYNDFCQDRAIAKTDPYSLKGFGEARTLRIKTSHSKDRENRILKSKSKSSLSLNKLCQPIKNIRSNKENKPVYSPSKKLTMG